MDLRDKLVTNVEVTFGETRFAGFIREVRALNEETGRFDGAVQHLLYSLKVRVPRPGGVMKAGQIEVRVPVGVPKLTFAHNAPVEIVNPKITAAAETGYNGGMNTYIYAENIIPAKKGPQTASVGSSAPASPNSKPDDKGGPGTK